MEYEINSLKPYYNTNELKRISLMNTFSRHGVKVIESSYTIPSTNNTTTNVILVNENINIINYRGIFNIEADLT